MRRAFYMYIYKKKKKKNKKVEEARSLSYYTFSKQTAIILPALAVSMQIRFEACRTEDATFILKHG